uniref:SMAP domain-containing protein n=1 Tax=Glossina brevipalpis TaxID=37001 RepID=A0A1A9X5B3_9MUSC
MEGLVNYSSEEDQDAYQSPKVAERSGGCGSSAANVYGRGGGYIKRNTRSSSSSSDSRDNTPSHKNHKNSDDIDDYRTGNAKHIKSSSRHYNDEDKYRVSKRIDTHKESREKRDSRHTKESRDSRSHRGEDYKSCDNGHKYDYKRHGDRYRYSRDHKKEHRHEDKPRLVQRHEERKSSRYESPKPRHEDRRAHEERRMHDERRSGCSEYEEKRFQRSYNEDKCSFSSKYRYRRSPTPQNVVSGNAPGRRTEKHEDYNCSRRERQRHSRSRSRSRSESAEKHQVNRSPPSTTHDVPEKEVHADVRATSQHDSSYATTSKLPAARNFEHLCNLPLSETAPKQPNTTSVMPVINTSLTSTNAAATTTTVQLPSYYNPNVINPNKYAQQMQKRKLLWGAKKTEDSASKWGNAQFSQDTDGKVASKFMRLMGIKNTGPASATTTTDTATSSANGEQNNANTAVTSSDVKSREAMFSSMEQQYEVARQATHTMRGVGFGFSSQARPF